MNEVKSEGMNLAAEGMGTVASRIFGVDERIRYVGIVDMEYRVLLSQMRSGLSSLTDNEKDRHFLSIVPRIMIEGAEKLEPDSGQLEFVTARYKNLMVEMYRVGQHIVMVSFDPSVETPFSSSLSEQVERIFSEEVATPLHTDF